MATENDQPPPDRRISELASAQHGVVSRAQLEAIDVRHGAIAHRIGAGRLHRIHRGVYSPGHALLTAEGRWMAAVIACGRGALLSHRSAGALWAIRPTSTGAIDVTVPARGGRLSRGPITIHRSSSLTAADAAACERIPVTSPARTLLDLGDILPAAALERAFERAEVLRLLDLTSIRAALAANPTRRGSGRLAAILERQHTDPAIERSELEGLFLELCSDAGLPRPLVNARVGPYEVDFLWPDARVVVETDGHSFHSTRAAFERDRARDALLVASGYRMLRFTYRQVAWEPEVVVRRLCSVLGVEVR
jgi:hypothetical protein